MNDHGFQPVHIVLQLDPPWTTDWMSQDARERLRQYGISPPQGHACHADMPAEVSCPRCGSTHTSLISEFGSTACKALYRCDSCREPLITLNVFEVAMTTFYSLKVARVEPETRDAVTITFAIPQALQAEYCFRPGQHLTLKPVWAAKNCAAVTPFVAAARRAKLASRSKPSTADASRATPSTISSRVWSWR